MWRAEMAHDMTTTLKQVCIACLNPCADGKIFELTTGRGRYTVVQCGACVEKYDRAKELSHVQGSVERREWMGYMPLLMSNLNKLRMMR